MLCLFASLQWLSSCSFKWFNTLYWAVSDKRGGTVEVITGTALLHRHAMVNNTGTVGIISVWTAVLCLFIAILVDLVCAAQLIACEGKDK